MRVQRERVCITLDLLYQMTVDGYHGDHLLFSYYGVIVVIRELILLYIIQVFVTPLSRYWHFLRVYRIYFYKRIGSVRERRIKII